MHLSYTQLIKRPAIFQRLTGLSVKEFEKLLAPFSGQYEQLVIGPRVNAPGRVRAEGGGQKGLIPAIEDKMLFILVYTRIYPLLFVHGLFFGMACVKSGRFRLTVLTWYKHKTVKWI